MEVNKTAASKARRYFYPVIRRANEVFNWNSQRLCLDDWKIMTLQCLHIEFVYSRVQIIFLKEWDAFFAQKGFCMPTFYIQVLSFFIYKKNWTSKRRDSFLINCQKEKPPVNCSKYKKTKCYPLCHVYLKKRIRVRQKMTSGFYTTWR